MVESFYGVLGVGPDADSDEIEHSYRRLVKECHPDVSGASDATERFKRLTSAKETLLDDDQRRRYDSLGHRAYLKTTGGCPGWTVPEGDREEEATDRPGGSVDDPMANPERRGSSEPSTDSTGPAERRRHGSHRTRTRTDGGRSQRVNGFTHGSFWDVEGRSRVRQGTTVRGFSLSNVAGRLGAWVILDVLLLVYAIGMAGFVYTVTASAGAPSPAVLALLVVVVGITVLLVTMHAGSKLSR